MVVPSAVRPLVAGLVLIVAVGFGPADDPPPKPAGNAWTFDEAVDRLSLTPRDPYLQYVVLQLGRRDGREREAAQAVDRQGLLSGLPFVGGNGRRRTDLFATFTGALAVQESLQLDTMRPPANPLGPGTPTPPPGAPAPPPGTVKVETLAGPTQPSHPWEKMLAGKTPDVGPLAPCVPDDYYFAEFRSVSKLHAVLAAGEVWAGHVFTQALGDARSQETAARVKAQLGLGAIDPAAIDKLGVEAVAVTGSDPFLAEGSDITLLIQGKTVAALAGMLGGAGEKGEHAGIAYTARVSPDRAVSVYAANPRPDLHVRGNSLPAFKRVLECVAGKTADGKPAKRLGETAEFKYVRTRMPRGAAEEDGFVYLSDSFIRRLTGPQLKLTEQRRVLVYNHLRMIGHAALLFRTEHGRPPRSLDELAEAKCAPGVFGQGDLAHPDGGTYSLSADGMAGVCSKWGRAGFLSPCVEHPVAEVSGPEAREYQEFVARYSQYWRTFFDPIAVRASLSPEQYRLETLVLPLIENSIYADLARGAGKPAAMDLLPTPKREVGGVWVHFDKTPLVDALGEYAAKTPPADPNAPPAFVGPAGAVRRASGMQRQNDLKQIALAFHNHESAFGKFPDDIRDKAGKPLLSWRVAPLPYIEQDALYKEFKRDEPWDSDHNKKLLAKIPTVYAARVSGPNGGGKTAYLRPVGKNTLHPGGKEFRIADITDGSSNTILVVEAADAAAVEWTRPADYPVDPKEPKKNLARPADGGFNAAFADGSVRFLANGVDPAALLAAFDPADGRVIDLDGAPAAPVDPSPKAPLEVANDLKQIGLAVHNYESSFGHLPTGNVRDKDGKPLLSWRVAILPYIEQDQLYRQFKLDQPWDSEHNKTLLAKMPRVYAGPDAKLNAAGKTAVLGFAGKGLLFGDAPKLRLVQDIPDGTSNTVLAVVADPAAAVEWTRPDDLPFDPKDPLKGAVRPGAEAVELLMADGATKRLSPRVAPKTFTALVTPAGGEVAELAAGDDLPPPPLLAGPGPGLDLRNLFLSPGNLQELESAGVDLAKLRRFLADGIGDQVGFHTHDAPRLVDSDLTGLFGAGRADGDELGAALALVGRLVLGPSSVSVPVKDPKVVDEYLAELDRLFLAKVRGNATTFGVRWRQEVDFYTTTVAGHHIRVLVVNLFGLKWRVYWGRIGDGLYVATRPFILEDIAAAQAAGGPRAKTDPAHAVLRLRPENWQAVRPGYDLGWAEANRSACADGREMVASVARGWNDRAVSPALLARAAGVYGARPGCPDGGEFTLTPDGRECRCSVHGGADDPRQPPGPTAASPTGKLLKTFGGLTAAVRFEDDGLRVVVTVDRKE